MKIYLTGYSGFIGSSIYKTLSAKYEIVKINLRKIDFQNTRDLNNCLNLFNESNVVINCAASLKPKSKNDFFLNEQFPIILYEHLKNINNNTILIHLSTINVLIDQRKDLYTISKKRAEENLENANCNIIRLPLIYKEENGMITKDGNLSLFFQYLDYKLPFYPMIFPGHKYEALKINKLINFLEKNFLENNNPNKYLNISGENKINLWDIFEKIAKQKNKKIIKIKISKFIPKIVKNILSKRNNFLQQLVEIDNSDFSENKTIIK